MQPGHWLLACAIGAAILHDLRMYPTLEGTLWVFAVIIFFGIGLSKD